MQEERWQVLHVITNHEKKVAHLLSLRSLEHCLPVYTERSRWSDRTVTLERPLFPGYIFVRLSPESRLTAVSVPGALKLLGKNGTETVDSVEIDRIRKALAGGYSLRPHPHITAGSRVRLRRGIFEGVTGIVTQLRRDCTVVMELLAIEHSFSLEADINDLDILDA